MFYVFCVHSHQLLRHLAPHFYSLELIIVYFTRYYLHSWHYMLRWKWGCHQKHSRLGFRFGMVARWSLGQSCAAAPTVLYASRSAKDVDIPRPSCQPPARRCHCRPPLPLVGTGRQRLATFYDFADVFVPGLTSKTLNRVESQLSRTKPVVPSDHKFIGA